MQPNPYAAPRADIVPPPPPPPGGAPGGYWEIGETLSAAWRAYASAWAPLTFAFLLVEFFFVTPMLVLGAAFVVPHFGASPEEMRAVMEDPVLHASMLGWNAIILIGMPFFQVGLVRMRLAACRGEPVGFGALFSGGSRYGAMFGLQLLLAVPGLFATTLGVIGRFLEIKALVTTESVLSRVILVVLLILNALGLAVAEYFVVERGQGPIEAIKSSLSATTGVRGRVFGFLFVTGLIAMAGLFCCGLPALVTVPYATVCVATLYTRVAP